MLIQDAFSFLRWMAGYDMPSRGLLWLEMAAEAGGTERPRGHADEPCSGSKRCHHRQCERAGCTCKEKRLWRVLAVSWACCWDHRGEHPEGRDWWFAGGLAMVSQWKQRRTSWMRCERGGPSADEKPDNRLQRPLQSLGPIPREELHWSCRSLASSGLRQTAGRPCKFGDSGATEQQTKPRQLLHHFAFSSQRHFHWETGDSLQQHKSQWEDYVSWQATGNLSILSWSSSHRIG